MTTKSVILLTVSIFCVFILFTFFKGKIVSDTPPPNPPQSPTSVTQDNLSNSPLETGMTTTIQMNESGFSPKEIEIAQGDTVTFQNIGKNPHWPASNIHPSHQIFPEFDPKKEIKQGETWSFTFYKSGNWRFHDHIYAEFSGEIKVKENKNLGAVSRETDKKEKMIAPINPNNIDTMLAKVNMMTIAKNDDGLRSWLKLAGAKKVMEKLLVDSGGGATIDCHQESHSVGRIGYELYGPSVFLDGTAACHSGYYHGAMETFLKEKGTKNLIADIQEICSKFSTSFGIFECLHGVGHGVMAYKDYDLPKTLETCGSLKTDYDQNSCYGGAFMENVIAAQGLGAVIGHGTRWANKEDPQFPCNKINQDYNVQYQCYQMQTSWMLTIFSYNFDRVAQECLKVRPDMVSVCFKSYGRDAAGHTLRKPEKIVELCSKVPRETDYYEQCIVGAVNVIIDFWGGELKSQATDLCRIVEEKGKKQCYSTLAWRLNDIFGSTEQRKILCNTFEEGYHNLCKSS